MLLIERQRKTLGLITPDVFQASPSHTVVSALCARFWVKMPLGLAYVAATTRIFSVRPRPKEGKRKESSGGCRFLSLCHTTSGACRRCLSTGREELCTHSTQSSTGHMHCQGALGATGWRTWHSHSELGRLRSSRSSSADCNWPGKHATGGRI